MKKSVILVLFAITVGSAILGGCGGKKVDDEGQGKPMKRATADDPSAGSLANPKPTGVGK